MKIYRLENDLIELEILSLGATLLSFKLKSDGINTIVRYKDLNNYVGDTGPYLGACIGPCAGRIGLGKFSSHQLSLNNGENHLHGGHHGVHGCDFDCSEFKNALVFTGTIDHTLDGYPGAVRYEITYSIENSTMTLALKAWPDQEQHLNLTNHAYFNLDGDNSVREHRLFMDADHLGLLSNTLVFEGETLSTKDTIFDFSKGRILKDVFESNHSLFEITRNLDQTFSAQTLLLEGKTKSLVVKTTAPALHLYAANYFDESFIDEKGRKAQNQAALAIEPQGPSNEVNFNPDYPRYNKDNPFYSETTYTLKANS